jgi:hypothetical protein
MKAFIRELEENFETFRTTWDAERQTAVTTLQRHRPEFMESYFRIVSMQAWRADVLEQQISPGALSFFLEAQNDALVSHVLAQMGSWRQALQALRSAIENVLFCAYYMNHPVELALWSTGAHKVSFSELIDYFSRHPKAQGLPPSVTGIAIAKSEYGVLSRAVHASAQSFRMTQDGHATQLWIPDRGRIGPWLTREKAAIAAINLLLLTLFRDQLQGAALPGTRKAISLAVPKSRHYDIKNHLGVRLLSR